MRPLAELGVRAREFAGQIQELLNQTVCNGARVSAAVAPADLMVVGTNLDTDKIAAPVALSIGRKRPRAWIEAQYRCFLDADGYLTVRSSYCAVSAHADGTMPLCHFDYERDKGVYPEAHLQANGHSEALEVIASPRSGAELAKLHFPVGPRRFRPCLEDIIEFLIVERFVTGRDGWQDVVNDERAKYLKIQLRAAVRRDPQTARSALNEIDSRAGKEGSPTDADDCCRRVGCWWRLSVYE